MPSLGCVARPSEIKATTRCGYLISDLSTVVYVSENCKAIKPDVRRGSFLSIQIGFSFFPNFYTRSSFIVEYLAYPELSSSQYTLGTFLFTIGFHKIPIAILRTHFSDKKRFQNSSELTPNTMFETRSFIHTAHFEVRYLHTYCLSRMIFESTLFSSPLRCKKKASSQEFRFPPSTNFQTSRLFRPLRSPHSFRK